MAVRVQPSSDPPRLPQELQRYPRLHAQLIEVVSELLRERLGPTSEYVQSLISIQAAYINTNHPDFVKGSAVAAQESARISREKRLIQPDEAGRDAAGRSRRNGAGGAAGDEEGEASGSGPEDEDETSGQGYLVPNGRPSKSFSDGGHGRAASGHDRQRSMSSTVQDRALHGPSFSAAGNAQNAQSGSTQNNRYSTNLSAGGGAGSSSMTSPLRSHSPMPGYPGVGIGGQHHDRHASAKESFLNYFFGGNPTQGDLSGSSAAAAAARMGASGGELSGLGRENPLTGRKGLEGNAAAFEMKSLEKHLEPVRRAPVTFWTAKSL